VNIAPLADRVAFVVEAMRDDVLAMPHGEVVAVALINALLAAMEEPARRELVRSLAVAVLRRAVPGMSDDGLRFHG
jgi:hypothetical protein